MSRNPEARNSTPEEDLTKLFCEIETEMRSGKLKEACQKLKEQFNSPDRIRLLRSAGFEDRFNAAKTICSQSQLSSNQ